MLKKPAMGLQRIGLLFLVLLSSCERCSAGVPDELRVAGPTPYVRCLAATPPKARQWRVGRAELKLSDRTLTIDGWPESVRIAAFSGPAFANGSSEGALKKMAETHPRLAIMLGGVGDDRDKAIGTLRLLGQMDFPSLVIAGGRDRWSDLRAAFSALDDTQKDRVIDATPLRAVRIGRDTLAL